MSLSRSDDFIADVERQFEWYVSEAGWQVADGYLNAVETTCRLVEKHPQIGPVGHFSHVRLRHWRFFVLLRPSFFMKLQGKTSLCAGQCMVAVTCHGDCSNPRAARDANCATGPGLFLGLTEISCGFEARFIYVNNFQYIKSAIVMALPSGYRQSG